MTVYADYDCYINEYLCGKEAVIDTASFDFYARQATQKIKQYTFDNVPENIPYSVKMCCCEIAELIFNDEKKSNRTGITSAKVGDESYSYESTESQRQLLSKNIKSAIYSWLSDTGLLYRGVKKC